MITVGPDRLQITVAHVTVPTGRTEPGTGSRRVPWRRRGVAGRLVRDPRRVGGGGEGVRREEGGKRRPLPRRAKSRH